jgi:hypothetical protein
MLLIIGFPKMKRLAYTPLGRRRSCKISMSDLDLGSPAENIGVITNELDIRVTPFISLYFLELLKQPCPRCLPQKKLKHIISSSSWAIFSIPATR